MPYIINNDGKLEFHYEHLPTPTLPLYPPPIELATLVATIAASLQIDPVYINALRIADLDIPDSDVALEAAQALVYTLVCAQAGFHPTLSIVDVTESHP